MKIYNSINELPLFTNSIVTQGTFDGVHNGHKTILSRLSSQSKKHQYESVVITFYPHPRLVLQPDNNELKMLNTLEEKTELLALLDIQHLLVLPFTSEIYNLEPYQYVRDILVNKLKLKKIIIGYDHRFGKNRKGTIKDMLHFSETYNFEVEEISAMQLDEITISSTKIRKALLNGDVQTAQKYLGNYYSIYGKVVHGNKIGRTIGYPTANIIVEDKFKLIPANGIYAVHINIDNRQYKGMMSIGNNPTVQNDNITRMEVNIFDFNNEIYDTKIKVSFIAWLRKEKKFSNLEELKNQLQIDELNAKEVFSIL